jgi:hypothetical protein
MTVLYASCFGRTDVRLESQRREPRQQLAGDVALRDARQQLADGPRSHIDNNDGNWVFIPRCCVSYYPGAQYMTN